MGKKLIIKGADFSANGMRIDNVVNVLLKQGGTNPYVCYFLPTPAELVYDVNTFPTPPADAIAKSLAKDGDIEINNDNIQSFIFGQAAGDSGYKAISELSVSYNKQIANMAQSFMLVTADTLDLRGMNFASGLNAMKMFNGATIKHILANNLEIDNARAMFYNFGNQDTMADYSLAFIKKITGDCTNAYQYVKGHSVDFGEVDLSSASVYNSMFYYCQLTKIDLSKWTFNNSPTHAISMFQNTPNLAELHLDNWNARPGFYTNMFSNTPNLAKVFVSNCTSESKTWLIARLNENTAGGSSNWVESSEGGKAVLVHGA